MINKKVLVVADAEWWVFDKIYRGIRDNISDWDVSVHYTKKSRNINHSKYSVVLFLCDYQYQLIFENNIPREKLILAIRSNVRHDFYNNSKNFGAEFRGLNIVKSACEKLNFIFNPAIREEKLRSEDEMVKYYHDEIDIYVDMSIAAGRQNGLLEAGSCGLPIISSRVGIADSLIIDGENGILCDRNVNELVNALQKIISIANKYGENI